MKFLATATLFTLGFLIAIGVPFSSALAGAEHFEWPIVVLDYNDCTGEDVLWTGTVRETLLINETPSGQVLILDKWSFEATVEGLSTGYLWSTKGTAPYVETFSLENSLTGGFVLVENATMKPETEGAPRVRLDVKINLRFTASGDLVVDRFTYTYHCVGH